MSWRLILVLVVWVLAIKGMFPSWLLNAIANAAQSGDWSRLITALGLSALFIGIIPGVYAGGQRAPKFAVGLLSAVLVLACLVIFTRWLATTLFGDNECVAGASAFISAVFYLAAIAFGYALILRRNVMVSLCAIPIVVISGWSILSAPALLSGAQRVADGADYRIFISDNRGGYASAFRLWDLRGSSLNGFYGTGSVVSHHAVLDVDNGTAIYYWSKAALNWHPARGNRVLGSAAFERARAAP